MRLTDTIWRALATGALLVCPALFAGVQYDSRHNILWVTDFPAGFPCTLERLLSADAACGWGKVSWHDRDNTYTIDAHLYIGADDGTDTYFQLGTRTDPAPTLVVNGATTGIPVSGGSFSKKIVLSPGANTLRVVAASARGTGSRAVTVFSRVPGKDLKIVLTWDTPGTDVDLWVIDPKGVKCWYRRKRTRAGGTLDTDVTSGYGPETFTQARSLPGPYRIVAHYYSARGSAPTEVKVEVIQFEGTPRERRLVRRGVLHRSKQQLRVAVVSVR